MPSGARVRFLTGAKTTVYQNNYKPKVFATDRPGRCPICTQVYEAGTEVMWAQKTLHGNKQYLPAHKACVEWEHKSRQNVRTKDGNWGLRPSR